MVVPHQEHVSGGRVYNTELGQALRRRGWDVEELRAAADWPWATPDERKAVRTALALPPGEPVLIDGLVGSACPEEIEAAAGAGVPVILLVHLPLPAETGLSHEQQAHLAGLERRALDAATAVATTSHWAAADLGRRYSRPDVRVLVPGVGAAPVAAGSEPPRILMAAAFTKVKNHLTVLAALDLVDDLPWQAMLIGAHRDAETVRAVRRHLRTSDQVGRISLPGELRGAVLDRVWHGTDLLLVPSWTETYGLVVIEALARGIPAVISRGTGAVEALTGTAAALRLAAGPTDAEVPGAVADPADPREWAQILRDWLSSPVRRERWRRTALQRRVELRTWADTAGELEVLLREYV